MPLFVWTAELPGTPELQLSGIRKEWSKSTRDHYQVALSHLKATWQVYTEQLRVHARHSPFTVGQSIFMTVGDGRHLTIDKSVSAVNLGQSSNPFNAQVEHDHGSLVHKVTAN
jgi:hypothetical protein